MEELSIEIIDIDRALFLNKTKFKNLENTRRFWAEGLYHNKRDFNLFT